jgi:NAD(P)-dependent dehydrogenase (short-subunit alcohol dehydrogenase family)
MFSLQGKVAVVTGAGSGIGEAIARAYADAGAKIVILERNKEAGDAVAASLTEASSATCIECDVADEASVKVAAQIALDANDGYIDILVNNAGIGHVGTILTTGGADLDRMYGVNVRGVMFVTQAFLPAMVARKKGVIVNMASIGGIVAVRDRFAYTATKFAVVGMTKCIALDHADDGIRCNCICPGRVETPFVQARLAEYPDPVKAREDMASTQALKRMGQPVEIAAAALYLASDEAAFVTGSSLIIDGGWTAGK